MIGIDLLFAFIVALLLSLLLVPVVGGRRQGGKAAAGILFVFLILFLATWAGGLWMTPIGPPYWLPFLLVGLLVTLLLAAMADPSGRWYGKRRVPAPDSTEAAVAASVGVFFWVLLIALLGAVTAGYYLR